MHEATCLIITGMPASGKSTVSNLVAQEMSHSALLNGDQINRLIISGRVWALGSPPEEAARQVRLCNKNLATLAANFVDAGFTSIIDWIIPDRQQLNTYIEALQPRGISLVVLSPAAEVCRARNRVRQKDERVGFDEYESLQAQMRSEYGDLGWWFDTEDLTPEQTASAIVSGTDRKARLPSRQR